MAHSLIAYAVPVEGPAPGLFSLNVPSFVWPRFFVSELLTTNIMILIYLKWFEDEISVSHPMRSIKSRLKSQYQYLHSIVLDDTDQVIWKISTYLPIKSVNWHHRPYMRVCTMGTLWDHDAETTPCWPNLISPIVIVWPGTKSRERFQTRSIFTKLCKGLYLNLLQVGRDRTSGSYSTWRRATCLALSLSTMNFPQVQCRPQDLCHSKAYVYHLQLRCWST